MPILPGFRRISGDPDTKPPQFLMAVNFRYRFMNKFVAFLQHGILNKRLKPVEASLDVALGRSIRIVAGEGSKLMRAFFI